MYYLYFSHTGYYYTDTRKLSEEDTYCYDCMDSDELIGEFKDKSGLTKLLKMDNAYQETISRIVYEWEQDFIMEETISFRDVLDILSRTVKDLDTSKSRKYDLQYTDGWLDACDTFYKYIKGEME